MRKKKMVIILAVVLVVITVISFLPLHQIGRKNRLRRLLMKFYEIGEMEYCRLQAVRCFVILAREKIKAQMKKYLCA